MSGNNTDPLRRIVEDTARIINNGLAEEAGYPPGYDFTKGNQCHLQTHYALQHLKSLGLLVCRELHMDDMGNWHFMLAHSAPSVEPSDTEIVTDFNPWQWRNHGGSILHGPRNAVIEELKANGAPSHVIALRGLGTIRAPHYEPVNPFSDRRHI